MVHGVLLALAAGMMWGLAFVGPLLLPDYPAVLQSMGRYVALGLLSVPLAWMDRADLRQLRAQDWREALALSVVGNLLYYLCLASAIQHAGAPLPTLLIGTLPVVLTIAAKLRNRHGEAHIAWRSMLPSLLLIGVGIACVNAADLSALRDASTPSSLTQYAVGGLLGLGAVACWTWYPLRNADWLRAHPQRNARAWATAQGLVTLPLAAVGYAVFAWHAQGSESQFALPLGPRPAVFVGIMLVLGLFTSWLGTVCWNAASRRLPASTVAQLIVFETLFALAYAFLLHRQWPEPLTATGIALLVAGVVLALRSSAKAAQAV